MSLEDTFYSPVWGGLLGLIILILDIIAIFEVLQSGRSMLSKLLWILLIFFFPIVGLIIYW
ncbi:881_t:CDS:2 [Cetraspora pellucida]|uniref:881_t:CDS:1 n=1 Tax=Cetraspora pellucida TaxID=1433469 RepID=A0A9N9CHM4_9GLOM|nr:881_t:CDS:2 [Cetraspora pellucida]